MPITSATAMASLFFLLPGLLGLLVFEQVAEQHTKRSPFDKIIIAAAIALLSVAVTNWALESLGVPGVRLKIAASGDFVLGDLLDTALAASIMFSVILAAGAAGLHNSGQLFSLLRFLRLTNQTGRMDVWHEAFSSYRGHWVRLTFKDGTVLLGYPYFYSSIPDHREIFVADVTWTDGESGKSWDIQGPGVYVNNLDEVVTIEFFE